MQGKRSTANQRCNVITSKFVWHLCYVTSSGYFYGNRVKTVSNGGDRRGTKLLVLGPKKKILKKFFLLKYFSKAPLSNGKKKIFDVSSPLKTAEIRNVRNVELLQ